MTTFLLKVFEFGDPWWFALAVLALILLTRKVRISLSLDDKSKSDKT